MTPRERLAYLADHVLPNVKDEEFDLKAWKCDTVACACGHAAMDPVLMKEGFQWRGLYRHGCSFNDTSL